MNVVFEKILDFVSGNNTVIKNSFPPTQQHKKQQNMVISLAEQKHAAEQLAADNEFGIKNEPETKISLDRKIHFVYNCFYNALKTISFSGKALETKNEEVGILWQQFAQAHRAAPFFNFDYFYEILKVYENYTKHKNESQMCEFVVLAILLQRVLGKMKDYEPNAEFVRQFLEKKLGIFSYRAERVQELILSARTLDLPSGDLKVQYFHDLQLSRLAAPYLDFVMNQSKLRKENIQLTDREFFGCQAKIYEKLLGMPRIFCGEYFMEKFEKLAKENIDNYLDILGLKLFKIEEEKKKFLENS